MPKKAKQNEVDYIILGMLNHESMSGYDIKGRIDASISNFWSEIGLNQIYPSLKKLEKKNLVQMKVDDRSYPPKNMYSITEEGKGFFIKWLTQPLKMSKHGFSVIEEFLLKLYFSSEIPRENVLKNIEIFELWLKRNVEIFNEFEKELRHVLNVDKDHQFYLLTVLFGKTLYNGLFDWIDQTKKLMKQEK